MAKNNGNNKQEPILTLLWKAEGYADGVCYYKVTDW